jgi:hypothetical protein
VNEGQRETVDQLVKVCEHWIPVLEEVSERTGVSVEMVGLLTILQGTMDMVLRDDLDM